MITEDSPLYDMEASVQPIGVVDTDTEDGSMTFVMPYEDDDASGETKRHIVDNLKNKHILDGPGVTAQDIVDAARLMGEEVEALCGYRWVPLRNPENHPPCELCMKAIGEI